MRVFLVEDSSPVAERLSQLRGSIPGTRVVGCVAGAKDAIRGSLAAKPDIVLLDVGIDFSSCRQ